jgi:Ca2+-binding EF-hand superfamily protein
MARRILKADLNIEAILAMDADGNGSIDLAEFLEFMLVKMGKCSQFDIDKIKRQFNELDIDGSGTLDHNDIKRAVSEHPTPAGV